ncbi:DUF2779 domain-containing protein [symbiont of Argiope bruennichi]|uniref:DUF2779 domain-containing protein n=1 Tax=symbiont of Argiope bruennichi TaxID=2810479 RepID=UPI003DA641CA
MSEKLLENNFFTKSYFADFFHCELKLLLKLIKNNLIKHQELLKDDINVDKSNDSILADEGICFDSFVKDFLLSNKKNIIDFRKFKTKNYQEKILLTNFYFKSQKNNFINPVFKYKNFITEPDYIEVSHQNKTIKIFEIKSFSFDEYDGKSKKNNIWKYQIDLLFQKFVLENATKYKVIYFGFYLPNKEYIFKNKLSKNLVSLIDKIPLKGKNNEFISLFNGYLNNDGIFLNKSSEKKINEKLYLFDDFKPQNLDLNKPYFCNHCSNCNFFSFCQKRYLNDDKENIFKLSKFKIKDKLLWFNSGYRYIKDVPEKIFEKNNQKKTEKTINKIDKRVNIAFLQYKLIVDNIKEYIDLNVLENILNQYQNKIFMIDFETINLVVPQFKSTKPHEQVPFLYSIHVIDKNGNIIVHKTHIEDPKNFSLTNFIKKFVDSLEFSNDNTYVAYWKSFEQGICNFMLKYLKSKSKNKYEKEINILKNIIDKFFDLIDFFHPNIQKKTKIGYFARDFYGKTSIKYVLPSVNKNFSYKNLNIQNGMEAMNTYRKFLPYYNDVKKSLTSEDWVKHKNDLLKYCELDTLAMVEIYIFLLKIAKKI